MGETQPNSTDLLVNPVSSLERSKVESKDEIVIPESFEGPEKLLEVWFVDPDEIKASDKPSDKKEGKSDSKFLRTIERKKWDDALNLVRCKILNVVNNKHFDAYLLSESSLFVWPKKLF